MVMVRAMEVEDIIIDILSWLPVRSLLRFRCVCKSWRALICSPDFIAKHLRRAATKKVLVSNVPSPLFPQLLDYKSLTTDSQSHNAVDGGYEFPDGFNDLSFLGSCNGLVCLKGKYVGFYGVNRVFRLFNENTRVLLWNPSTREIRKLPDIDVFKFGPLFYGFGYDSAAQDYKVVLGGWDDEDSGDSLGLHMVAIFSLKTGSWKIIRGFASQNITFQSACYFKGSLHWVIYNYSGGFIIKYFDLAKEKFRFLSLIDFDGSAGFIRCDLGTIGNRLCLFASRDSGNTKQADAVTTWVMMEYGVDESWTVLVTIPPGIMSPSVPRAIPVSHLEEDGAVLMRSIGVGFFVFYVPEKGTCRIAHEISPLSCSLEVAVFVETLVSPVTGSGSVPHVH